MDVAVIDIVAASASDMDAIARRGRVIRAARADVGSGDRNVRRVDDVHAVAARGGNLQPRVGNTVLAVDD